MFHRTSIRRILGLVAVFTLLSTRAFATSYTFTTVMLGSNEVPPNASPAVGASLVTINDVAHTLTVDITWAGLIGGNPAASHIHCCSAPGVNSAVAVGFPGFPATTAGSYFHVFNTLDSSIYNAPFLTLGGGTAAGAETLLIASMLAGLTYTNIHNAQFGGGEIRGQLAPVVPEPATWTLVGLGLVAIALRRRA